jgi:hypothetical protein
LLILLEVVPFSCGPAPHVSDDGLASLLILLEVVPFSCGPAPHVSDDGLATLIHMHMFDADSLRTAVPQAT